MDIRQEEDNQKPWLMSTVWQQMVSKAPPNSYNATSKASEVFNTQLYARSTIGKTCISCGLILPIAAAGVSLLVLLFIIVTMIILKKKKAIVSDMDNPSIVVYPSNQGPNPQFLTKDILFSLPPLRHSNSLDDLGESGGNDSDQDTEALVPATKSHSHRSNSFSCYGLGVIDPAMYRSCGSELEDELQFPEGHLGRIWFSVRYESATEKLLVSVLKAKNLPSRTVGTVNSCDPFIRFHLIPDERRYLQSKIKKKTCNPFFDETFIFQIASKQLHDHILKLTVIDSGRAKMRGVIGHVSLPLRDFVNETEQKLFKMDLEKETQEILSSDLGEVLVSLVYNENLNRLSVTVIEAKRLQLRGEKQESYVKVTLSQNYRPVKIKKTSTVKGKDPNYSECFNFRVTPQSSDVSNLSFQLYQTAAGYGRDKLIGKFVLGSYMFARGKANTHWTSAFSSPREAFQQWHALSA